MGTSRLVLVLAAAMAVTVVLVHSRRNGSGDPDSRTVQVTGVVMAPVTGGRMMVSHDDIPGYMPAMTMPFPIGAKDAAAIAPGDRVRFTLRVSRDSSLAEGIVIEGHDAAMAAALAARGPVQSRLKNGDALPPFSLTNQAGRPFTSDDTRGRVTALTFIFTRCPVPEFCPLTMKRFQQVQQALEADPSLKDVQLVSVTLDPEFDTPVVLDAYAKAMRADPKRWQFLTGTPAAIEQLTRAFSVHVERQGVSVDHTLATAIVGADGRVAQIWRGNGWKAGEIVDGLRLATGTHGDQ